MPNHLSILGIIHTAISIIAIIVALYALIRDGQINPKNGSGKLYILLTIITCITALPIMRTGHPTAGHNLAVIILVVLPIAVYAPSFKFLGKSAAYIQIFLMSLTLFFSFIPAIVETLTRVPISRPIANGPDSPVIKMGLLILVVLFTVGVLYQLIKLWSRQKRASGQTIDLA
jgi:phosphatidylglycerophosphate synthase